MRVGAAQAEIHAAAQIRQRPVHAVGNRAKSRVVERAVDVRTAFDGVALVEMGMNVDQCRPDLAAAEVDARNFAVAFAGRRCNTGDLAVLDQQIEPCDAFCIERRR